MFCGYLLTQGGTGGLALTSEDILESSETFRKPMDYFSHSTITKGLIEQLARETPQTLACMQDPLGPVTMHICCVHWAAGSFPDKLFCTTAVCHPDKGQRRADIFRRAGRFSTKLETTLRSCCP